ncbi:MAG: nuclear transport factor 2 family protein [Geodermatophilaceae bacterium]
MDRGVLVDTLMKLERQGWDSLCDSTGDTFYGQLMTDDAVMVLANGAVMDRAAVVAALGQAPPWRAYEISEVRLVGTGKDGAALVYVGTAYGDGPEPAFVGMMTSVYLWATDAWRLALYQQTPIPAADA